MAAGDGGRTPPPPPPPGPVKAPFAPGAEVEVLIADDFHGHWREATVVGFVPARRRDTHSAPDRYEVAYAHLDEGRGRQRPARSRVRPRPPPPASPPPRFLLHDAVEAFRKNAWRAGLVVSASPSTVTVAFPVTRKAIEFPPGLVRPRRVYIDGDWVPPSRAPMDRGQAYLRPARVYEVGDKVEVVRRGMMWVSATVARVVDDLSYVVEYDDGLDLEGVAVDGGAKKKAAMEYLHCKFIRPAVERLPGEMFQLGPGAAVEAYCDGVWSPAVVRRVLGVGEFEVSIHGNEAKPLVTGKVRPQYNWDGKQWTIVTAKVIQERQPNLKRQSMHGKYSSRPIYVASSSDEQSHDLASSGDEQSRDLESPTTKKSRKELQQPDAILADDSEHASVSEMNTVFSPPCKLPKSNHSPSSSSQFSQENSLRVLPCNIVGLVSMNGRHCASSGHSTPQNESVPKSNGEAVDKQEGTSDKMVSDGHLNAPLCVSAGDISELGKKMPSSHRMIPRKVISVKLPNVKNGISKNKGRETLPIHEPLGEIDASDKVSTQTNSGLSNTKIHTYETLERLDELRNPLSSSDLTGTVQQTERKRASGPMKQQPPLALDGKKSHTQQQMERNLEGELNTVGSSNQVLLPMVPASSESFFKRKGMHSSSRCTMEDSPVRSCSAGGSSMPSHLGFTQVPSHQVPFAKNSPLWPLIEAWDVFKDVPQQPHFLPLREFFPILREGMAFGMMMSYASLVKSIMEASIEQTVEWFEENMDALCHLEENGFNVQSLRCTLTKLLQIKSNATHYIEEIDKLEAEIVGKTSSLSRIDKLLDEKDLAVAELEQKLGCLRQESQKIAEEKEEDETKLSSLQAACSRLVEARGDAERQFLSVLRRATCTSSSEELVEGKGRLGGGSSIGNGSHLRT